MLGCVIFIKYCHILISVLSYENGQYFNGQPWQCGVQHN